MKRKKNEANEEINENKIPDGSISASSDSKAATQPAAIDPDGVPVVEPEPVAEEPEAAAESVAEASEALTESVAEASEAVAESVATESVDEAVADITSDDAVEEAPVVEVVDSLEAAESEGIIDSVAHADTAVEAAEETADVPTEEPAESGNAEETADEASVAVDDAEADAVVDEAKADAEADADEITETSDEEITSEAKLESIEPAQDWDIDEPIPMALGAHEVHNIIDSEDPDAPIFQETSTRRSDATLTSKGKKVNWKPRMFLVVMAVVSVIILVWSVFSLGNLNERLASPLTVGNQDVSNAEFSFMYHYVLLENGVDIFKDKTASMLAAPGENGFPTYRDYFLDATAKEIQTVYMLYDDAVAHGYSIKQDHIDRAKAYIDWLKGKADAIHVDLDTYIKGTFGPYVSKDLILQVLPKVYFTEDYAGNEKLEELKATEAQAEQAYQDARNSYDLVSFRLIRITFEAREESYVKTANIHAQQIVEATNHDQSKFESVAAPHFSGEMKQRLLIPDSTLHRRVRYSEVEENEWRNWLFDTERQPGDCEIFKDDYGFPIIFCFVERVRQDEPLRNVRFFYINLQMEDSDIPGIPAADILPLSQTIFDSITDEASMITLETTYADELLEGSIRAVQQTAMYPGNNSAEVDEWVFDPDRQYGDKILFEGPTQIVILFYVEASPNPEWYDRVNSFIRMDNYQAFVSEKLKDYAYKFHEDGLKHIEDVPS